MDFAIKMTTSKTTKNKKNPLDLFCIIYHILNYSRNTIGYIFYMHINMDEYTLKQRPVNGQLGSSSKVVGLVSVLFLSVWERYPQAGGSSFTG